MDEARFDVTPEELRIISKIADRAMAMAEQHGYDYEKIVLVMDLSATHRNGCPLKLQELLDAEATDFAHDVFGIHRHLDRKTGKLLGHFLPRFAKLG